MTYLELVTRAWRKCGLSGDGPTSVSGQTDMKARIVQFVADAYQFVQQQHPDWNFLWRRVDSNLVVDQTNYQFGDFGITDCRRLSRLLLQVNSKWVELERSRDYDEMADFDNPGDGTPTRYRLLPNGSLQFDNTPDDTTPIRVEYFRVAHALVSNSDLPLIPEEFQWVIIFKAQEYYAIYEEDPAMLLEAQKEYQSTLHRLMREQLPELRFPVASPFAE